MQNFKINGQDCIYSLADLNIGHCLELTVFEGKLYEFLVIRVKKCSLEIKTILI